MKNKVWFITGASKGLGLSLVKKLLATGYQVAATSRNAEDLKKSISSDSDNFLPIQADINSESDTDKAIEQTLKHFGSIDVLVNNAGYGLAGALEELTDAEARKNFDTNVFGTLNVIRKALPYMRKQQYGQIFNIASVAGFTGSFPGFGIYCATKFAVHGLSESLAAETKPFGIKVTVVSPGYFRTNFLESSSIVTPTHPLADYQNVRDTQARHQFEINGRQPGDPDKAADVMIETSLMTEPPLHLFLGKDAYQLAAIKMQSVQQDLDKVAALGTSTDYNE